MLKKQLVPVALSTLLLASPLAMGEETQSPEATAAPEQAPAGETTMQAAPGGMTMTDPGMMGGEQEPGTATSMDMTGSGMMGGMPGGCAGRPGMRGTGGMMGGGGMMGMMRGSQGGMMGGCGGGRAMQEHYRELMGRLDLLDARLAKIETMLEHLLQR